MHMLNPHILTITDIPLENPDKYNIHIKVKWWIRG